MSVSLNPSRCPIWQLCLWSILWMVLSRRGDCNVMAIYLLKLINQIIEIYLREGIFVVVHDRAGVVLCLQQVDLVEVHLVKVVYHPGLDVLRQYPHIVVPVEHK